MPDAERAKTHLEKEEEHPGHQQATTTMNYYIGIYDEERHAAVRDLETWMGQEDSRGYVHSAA